MSRKTVSSEYRDRSLYIDVSRLNKVDQESMNELYARYGELHERPDDKQRLVNMLDQVNLISRKQPNITRYACIRILDKEGATHMFDSNIIFEDAHEMFHTSDRIVYEIPYHSLPDTDPYKKAILYDSFFFMTTINRLPGKRVTGNDISRRYGITSQVLSDVRCVTCGRPLTGLHLNRYYGYVDHYYMKAVKSNTVAEYIEKDEARVKMEAFTACTDNMRACCRVAMRPNIVSDSYNRYSSLQTDCKLSISKLEVISDTFKALTKNKETMKSRVAVVADCIKQLTYSMNKLTEDSASSRLFKKGIPFSTTTLEPTNALLNQNEVLSSDSDSDDDEPVDYFDSLSSESDEDDPDRQGSESDMSDDDRAE